MKASLRWTRFNQVGAAGAVVQLAVLAMLNRCDGGHYLIATGVAIETALLHNFVWHLRYTWRDRRQRSIRLVRFARFQLSNGLVSLAGNLALMRPLMERTHLPVLAANGIAVLTCSIVNFFLGDRWVFAASRSI